MQLVSNWRGRGTFAAILALALLGIAMVLASAQTAQGQAAPSASIKQLTLSGSEEVPAVTANATGFFSGTLTDGNLEYDLSAVAPDIIQAHIHMGAKGANGPVVAFLFGPADPTVGAIIRRAISRSRTSLVRWRTTGRASPTPWRRASST